MAHIFISYSRKDEVFARKLATSLSDLGAEVWIDVDDIPVGMNWSAAIQQGLDTCDLILLIVSPDSMASRNVDNEWQFYLDNNKPVVPILWRPTRLQFQLNRLEYVDFSKQEYDVALRQLVVNLRGQHMDLRLLPPPPSVTISNKGAVKRCGFRMPSCSIQIAVSFAALALVLVVGGYTFLSGTVAGSRPATATFAGVTVVTSPTTAPQTPLATPIALLPEQIAYVSDHDGNAEIYVMDTDGHNQRNLTNNPADDSDPAWSPDSKYIVFSSRRDGNAEIYVMGADGNNVRRLTNTKYDNANPAWSPDGQHIAFVSNGEGNWHLYVMDTNGKNLTRIGNTFGNDLAPAWSPNGQQIVFQNDQSGFPQLYAVYSNKEAAWVRITTTTRTYDQAPAWSPDGRYIVFSSDRDGNFNIYRINSGNIPDFEIYDPHALTTSSAYEGSPAWSPDGKYIVYDYNKNPNGINNKWQIYMMEANGASQRPLTDGTSNATHPAWSPKPK
ncbi:MAG: TIR domain-containing protein [Chloroflexota bacterium]